MCFTIAVLGYWRFWGLTKKCLNPPIEGLCSSLNHGQIATTILPRMVAMHGFPLQTFRFSGPLNITHRKQLPSNVIVYSEMGCSTTISLSMMPQFLWRLCEVKRLVTLIRHRQWPPVLGYTSVTSCYGCTRPVCHISQHLPAMSLTCPSSSPAP